MAFRVVMTTSPAIPGAYPRLVRALRRARVLGSVSHLLEWDEQVNLPPDSTDIRTEQLSVMAEQVHAAGTSREIGDALAELEAVPETLTDDQRVVVRHARRDYDRLTRLPAEFVARRARHGSAAYHLWVDARARNDFAAFAPALERHLGLAREEAGLLGWGDRPYDYALDKNDPEMTATRVTSLFTALKRDLLPLVRAIGDSPVKVPAGILRGFPADGQRRFIREVTERLGFDYRRGRLDVSVHPFAGGCGSDVRMTTRFREDSPLDALFGAIHESGHALYEQGLSRPDFGTALGEHIGMAIHESQSRLWENQVGRSRAFWTFFEPRFREHFPVQTAGVDSETLYRVINAVRPSLIRVESDEVTYNLHILLRFEIEQRLFAGDLAVADLPAAWNTLAEELFGRRPPTDTLGVLQDIHWSMGLFGYFPSYCLGNMIAAQLWGAVRREVPGLEEDFAKGDFSRLLAWLRERIHRVGKRQSTTDLVRTVTGADLDPSHLIAYLRERYGAIYLS
jgi:carboxypeptidase Taq